jgi:Dynamin family
VNLVEDVRGLLGRAVAAFDGAGRDRLGGVLTRLDEPLRVALAGKVKAGKSTLLNALVGEELAPTDAGECTRIVTWYHDSHTAAVTAHGLDGSARPLRFTRESGALEIDLAGADHSEIARLDVQWPSGRLRQMTLVDTPGIDSLSAHVSQRTIDFLVPDDDRVAETDAVLYLMRHMHGSDVRFLESFHDDEIAQPSPVNAIGVLSRADEIGACRLDAMSSATRIASRYATDERLRRLVQGVVPVAGLLAQAAVTLAEHEYRNLGRLATMPAEDLDALLLSADRFVRDDPLVAVTAVEREDLLRRFGLFGVRCSIAEIAAGRISSSQALADRLGALSGLDGLRAVLGTQFAQRAALLKARTALNAVDEVARAAGGSVGDELAAEVERISAGAHELVEVRLLNVVRSGALAMRSDELAALEQLVGGGDAATRLGLGNGADPARLRAVLLETLGRWQQRAESALSSQPVKDAARVAMRSCEGLLAELPAAPA